MLTLIACLLLVSGLQPFGFWMLSYAGFFPIFLLAFDPKIKFSKLFFCALFAGAFYYGIFFCWLTAYSLRTFSSVWLIVSPVFAVYFSGIRLFSKINFSALLIPVSIGLWAALEKIFALTPLGAAALQLPFYGPPTLMQVVSYADFCLLSGALMGVNASAALLTRKKSPGAWCGFLLSSLVVSGIYFHGHFRMQKTGDTKKSVKVSLIQHNLPISDSWRGKHRDEIYRRYRELILKAAEEAPDLIVLPLYTLPDDPLRNPGFFAGLARSTKSHILIGSHIPEKPGGDPGKNFLDVAILYAPDGKIAGLYQAAQAPPFRGIPEITGDNAAPLKASFGTFGVLLCYEDVLPGPARKAVSSGAECIAALSNPGHFANTDLPYYHLFQDSLRAIESNRWLIRVSPNGYSAIVDPSGRWIKKSVLREEQVLTGKIGLLENTAQNG